MEDIDPVVMTEADECLVTEGPLLNIAFDSPNLNPVNGNTSGGGSGTYINNSNNASFSDIPKHLKSSFFPTKSNKVHPLILTPDADQVNDYPGYTPGGANMMASADKCMESSYDEEKISDDL